eukprot:scaffold12804_cov96-Isochrysis_galbana.AAC.3
MCGRFEGSHTPPDVTQGVTRWPLRARTRSGSYPEFAPRRSACLSSVGTTVESRTSVKSVQCAVRPHASPMHGSRADSWLVFPLSFVSPRAHPASRIAQHHASHTIASAGQSTIIAYVFVQQRYAT